MANSRSKLSPAQFAARRANAQKATGPRTDEGKARAAKNALLHGLCSLAPVLPGEDPAEFERLLALWIKEQQPTTEEERNLVFNMCCATVAIGRVRKADAAAASARIRQAGEAFDAGRAQSLTETTALVGRGRQDLIVPLLARADGVRWLIARWEELDEQLTGSGHLCPEWRERMLTMLGCAPGDLDDERAREVHGLVMALDVACDAHLKTHAQYTEKGIAIDADRPMERLRALIAQEWEALASLLPELEAEEAEQRQQVLDAAAVDTSDEWSRRHRYLQDHQRSFRQLSTALIACKNARLKLYGRILSSSENEPAWTPPEPTPPAPEAPARNEPKNDATPESERRFDDSYVPAAPRPASSVVVGVAPTPATAPPRRF
ncbi:MAG TPA: hypothetical protein VG406_05030 [Isosphaeraceae bacterium]|jgi:hypothetical protein|nr:hypothetical protein [Isosphaeraceae bacterium]